jgi:hypothetical protein
MEVAGDPQLRGVRGEAAELMERRDGGRRGRTRASGESWFARRVCIDNG